MNKTCWTCLRNFPNKLRESFFQEVTTLAFHPSSPVLVSGSRDFSIKFFDISKPSIKKAYRSIQVITEFVPFKNGKYRLTHEGAGDISFIARRTTSYFVTSERSERGIKYDIVTRAIKLILPSLKCDNLFITYLCLYQSYSGDENQILFSNYKSFDFISG